MHLDEDLLELPKLKVWTNSFSYRISVSCEPFPENVLWIHSDIFAIAKKITIPRPIFLFSDCLSFEHRRLPSIMNGVWSITWMMRNIEIQIESTARCCIIGTNVKIQSIKKAGIGITSKISSIFDTGFGLIFNFVVFLYANIVATFRINSATHSNILLIAMLVFR